MSINILNRLRCAKMYASNHHCTHHFKPPSVFISLTYSCTHSLLVDNLEHHDLYKLNFLQLFRSIVAFFIVGFCKLAILKTC